MQHSICLLKNLHNLPPHPQSVCCNQPHLQCLKTSKP